MSSKLKIAGAWSGTIELDLTTYTVPMLREEIAKRAGCFAGEETVNMIFSGKVLRDGDGSQSLAQHGLKDNGKVLATRVSVDHGKHVYAEEKANRLDRLRAAATALAKRHTDGYLPESDFNIELETQHGQKFELGSEEDQRALIMGIMFHEKAKSLLQRKLYEDALEVLLMGEEAFSLCNAKVYEMTDNVPILQLDIVWCYFILQDISKLSVAGTRLVEARRGLERAHGKDSARLRLLQGGLYVETAILMRLELLEGVVAYHSGQLEKSVMALTSAQAKYLQLQVSDETLSILIGMGYKERDSKRALRLNNQDVQKAVEYLLEEKERKAQKIADDIRRRNEIIEQKSFGVTPLGKAVNIQWLKQLVSVGFEKELAAESLRRNENDYQKALDDLTNSDTNTDIQLFLESRKKKRMRHSADSAIQALTSMGFPREQVIAAVRSHGTQENALNHLLQHCAPNNQQLPVDGSLPTPVSAFAQPAPVSASARANTSTPAPNEVGGEFNSIADEPSSSYVEEERDAEMEDDLTDGLYNKDFISDYDFELTREKEAIDEYLTLLSSGQKGEEVPAKAAEA